MPGLILGWSGNRITLGPLNCERIPSRYERTFELLPPSKKRTELEQWLDAGLNGWFGSNLLPVTKAISDRWGIFAAKSHQQGRPLGNIDGLLAATGFEHGLTVVTRNIKHFEDLGVKLFDPWNGQSP